MADDYEYVPDPDAWVAVNYGKFQSIGKLDAAGGFLLGARWVNVGHGPLPGIPPCRLITSTPGLPTSIARGA